MTREEFEYAIKSCGCFIYRGQTYYEETDLIKAFEDMGLIKQEPRYCDRNICLKNEYNEIGCDECEVTKSQEPSGDLINRQDAIKAIDEKAKRIKNEDTLNGLAGAVGILFDLPSVKPQEPKTEQFAKWVASEIFDEMWEYNKDAFAEIACRKLEKLGIVRVKGDEWELVEPQERSE